MDDGIPSTNTVHPGGHVQVKIEDGVDELMSETVKPSANERITPPTTNNENDLLQHGARFEEELTSMLQTYNKNSADADAANTTSYDDEYEEAITAVDQKREEIAMKESQGFSTATDRVQLKTLEANLNKTRKLQEKERANLRREQQEQEDNQMFVDQEGNDGDELEVTPAPSRRAAMNDERPEPVDISDDDEAQDEHTPYNTRRGGSSASKPTPKSRKTPAKTAQSGVQKRGKATNRGARGGRQGPSMVNMRSLIRNDIVADAAANQGAGEQASFVGLKTKKDVLAALIASIPPNHQDLKRGEKTALDKAAKKFGYRGRGSMQVRDDGWRLKGMCTGLKNFQLLGAAWGVERESGSEAPFGGILADTMGYGKTLQMITIMVENQPKPNAKNKTTLIVVPGSIVQQWVEEIARHTDDNVMENVLVYKSGSRIDSPNVVQILRRSQVIVTTYHEVMSNYPKCVLPAHLVTDKAKDDWWANYYEAEKGPLLRIPFYRIVLDEAQIMKNHESRTSKACRLLTAKYKWVLSGTPLSNCMEELFSYFSFLGVTGAGNFSQFKNNYAKRNDTTNQRLDAMLRTIMIRRTGSDRLLGKPLVTLPALDFKTIHVDFSPIERAIYAVVRQRFITRINDWSAARSVGAISKNIFVMLTRLRQMCAHVFMVAAVVRDLFETEDIEKLWNTVERHSRGDNEMSKTTAKVLQTILREAQDERESSATIASRAATPDTQNQTIDLTINDDDLDFRGFFYHLQRSGAWDRVKGRSLCHLCKELPEDNAKLSKPCGHLYCRDCLETLLRSAEEAGMTATCSECQGAIVGSADMQAMGRIAREAGDRSMSTTPSPERKKGKGEKHKSADATWLQIPGVELMSTKVQAIVSTLEDWIKSDPEAKIVVFTLWLPIIKVFSKVCARKGWGFQEYTGETSVSARNKALQKFQDVNEGDKILLMSTRAGGLGLNLVEASYAVIVDPWWNEAVEDQAFSRIYRIGQLRNCVVKRFVIKDAIDTQLMLHLQKLKAQECDRVIDGRSQGEFAVHDLMRLFGSVRKDPETNAVIIQDGGDAGDGLDEFVMSEDLVVVDDSDVEEVSGAPSRPEE